MTTTDNEKLRALLVLPPIQPSTSTALSVPQLPVQEVVTGHRETDAMLWLQSVVRSGNAEWIEKALESARAIRTPRKTLARIYADHLMRKHGDAMVAAFGSLGFGKLEEQAERATSQARRRHEGLSRFGSEAGLFAITPAEKACKAALRGLKETEVWGYDGAEVAPRFDKRQDLPPHTLDDCLYAMAHWSALYWLRAAWEGIGDPWPQAQAHDDYCFAQMANIPPRDAMEAMRVFEYVTDDRLDRTESVGILRNLITSGWRQQEVKP